MASYSEIAQSLTESLEPTQPLIAVCLTDSIPAGSRFWQEATRDLRDALKVFVQSNYGRDADMAAIPVLASKPKRVIFDPLAKGRSSLSLGCCGTRAYLDVLFGQRDTLNAFADRVAALVKANGILGK